MEENITEDVYWKKIIFTIRVSDYSMKIVCSVRSTLSLMMINHEHTLFQDRNVCLQDALDK